MAEEQQAVSCYKIAIASPANYGYLPPMDTSAKTLQEAMASKGAFLQFWEVQLRKPQRQQQHRNAVQLAVTFRLQPGLSFQLPRELVGQGKEAPLQLLRKLQALRRRLQRRRVSLLLPGVESCLS